VIKPREKLLGSSTAMARGTRLAAAGTVRKVITIRRKEVCSVQPRRAKEPPLSLPFLPSSGLRKRKVSALGTLGEIQL
jgi:hypothetical protein